MTEEARMEEAPNGLRPAGPGWFVVNVRRRPPGPSTAPSAPAASSRTARPRRSRSSGSTSAWSSPAQPLCLYHEESAQEDFLILAGEALLLVNGEERPLQTWDFVHSPAGTEHVIVGAGDGRAIVLAVGKRPDEHIHYPKSELAEKYGASAEADTPNPREAYARFDRPQLEQAGLLGRAALGVDR